MWADMSRLVDRVTAVRPAHLDIVRSDGKP